MKGLSSKKSFKDCSAVGGQRENQILWYDSDQLGDVRVLLMPCRNGSIFRRARIWWQIFIYFGIAAGLAAIFFFCLMEPEKIHYNAATNLSTYLNMFLPFLFGIYLNNIFSRWWSMRTEGLGGMNNTLSNMCMIMASHLRGVEGTRARHLLLRYGLLSHELVYRFARQTDGDLSDLVDAGAVLEEERELLQGLPGTSKAQAVWVWIQLLWDDQFKMRRVPPHIHQEIQREIATGRAAVKRIFTYLQTPMPFAYVHLMACLVHLNLLVLSIQAGMIAARSIGVLVLVRAGTGGTLTDSTEAGALLFSQVFYLTMVPMIYLGFLELAHEITDPFGTDPNDFPRAQIHNTMHDECEAFFAMGEALPPELMRVAGAFAAGRPLAEHGRPRAATLEPQAGRQGAGAEESAV